MSSKKTNEEKAGEIGSVANRAKAAGAASQKERDARSAKNAATVAAVAQITVDKAVQSVTTAGLSIQKSLAEVSAELQAKLTELEQVDAAIKIRTAELEDLHGKDVVAAALDVLLAKFEQQKLDLQKDIQERQAMWAQEQRAHEQRVVERNAETEKARKRDEDAYSYATAQRRKGEDDAWTEQLRIRGIEESERVTILSKSWEFRGEELAKREAALSVREAEVAKGLTEQQAKELKRDHAIELNSAKKQYEHQTALDKQTSESKIALLTAQAASVTAENTRLLAQLAETKAELKVALLQVTEVAKQAIDGASGQKALEQVMSLKQQDANGGTTRKS